MAASRFGRRRPGARWAVLAPLLCGLGCGWVLDNCGSSRAIIRELNSGQQPGPAPRVADEVRERIHKGLVDSYWTFWVDNPSYPFEVSAATQPIADATLCLLRAHELDSPDVHQAKCLAALDERLGLSPAPRFGKLGTPQGPSDADWQREQDSVRLSTVMGQTLLGVVAFLQSSEPFAVKLVDGRPANPELAEQVRDGVQAGLSDFIDYQSNRAVHRSRTRHTTAMVLSGGAANGAYSAGAVYWLLHELDRCRQGGGCGDDLVDMAAGTSTGCLIAAVIADY